MYKYSKAYSQWGAQMGRRGLISDPNWPVKFHLEKVQKDSGGYDKGGAYWGWGNDGTSLYVAWGDGYRERQEIFVEAANRSAAKDCVRESFANATFYR